MFIFVVQLTLKPSPGGSDAFEWHTLTHHKSWTGPKLELRLAVKMDKPLNLKKAGYDLGVISLPTDNS